MITGGGKNGRYFTLTDPAAVTRRWPHVTVCGICKRLDPAGASAVEAAIAPPQTRAGFQGGTDQAACPGTK